MIEDPACQVQDRQQHHRGRPISGKGGVHYKGACGSVTSALGTRQWRAGGEWKSVQIGPHCAASRCPSVVHSWLITEGKKGRGVWGGGVVRANGTAGEWLCVTGMEGGVKKDSRGADGQEWGALLLCRVGGVGGSMGGNARGDPPTPDFRSLLLASGLSVV